ncbi:G2/M phase-specific E3 ubiquitin-protein ligase-like [Clytia hemisphaerica]
MEDTEVTITIKDVISSLAIDFKSETSIRIRRGNCFNDFVEKMSSPFMKRQSKNNALRIIFYGEHGVDQGGVRRDFFTEAIQEIKDQLFVSKEDGMLPNIELYDDLANGLFRNAGKLFAYSICENGPAPNFLSPWVYDYIAGGLGMVLNRLPEKIEDKTYQKIYKIRTEQELKDFCTSDEGIDVLSEIKYRSVPSSIKLKSKEFILRSLFAKWLNPYVPFIQEIAIGLEQYGFLQKIKEHPQSLKTLFCLHTDFDWTFDEVFELLEPDFSPENNTYRYKEINTFKALSDALSDCYDLKGEENALTLSEVMKFITGCSSKPASGLPGKITVIFEKYCPENCRCKPTTSSCDIQIEVALHYTTKRDMMIALTDACRESKGMLRY